MIKKNRKKRTADRTPRVAATEPKPKKSPVLMIVVLVMAVAGFGAVVSYRSISSPAAGSAAARPPVSSSTPNYNANAPAKEYVYAGGKLLAVSEPMAPVPADLAIWRPSSGVWWVLGGTGSQQAVQEWGLAGDIPVPGDYDGDGKTDFCVFRPSDGVWYIVNSSTGTTGGIQFGQAGDKPVAADFDGDGRTDTAVYRAESGSGVWYILNSSGSGTTIIQFGFAADTPAPADFDGDGRADINVWRDSNFTFYSLFSTTGLLNSLILGSSSGTPIPADYDGDGKANYAVKSGSNWLILNANYTSSSIVSWQQPGDLPVHNDYDGDGIVDIAVWRDSNGTWYIRQSSLIGQSNELRQTQWGLPGDIPVPAFYRR
ncbi:MAG: FG-GAP repeat domain-containing protein [Pyrinomonadaceae bacterium]